MIDKRLFLPEPWVQDAARCRAAGVPEAEIRAQGKAEAAAMVRSEFEEAWKKADVTLSVGDL